MNAASFSISLPSFNGNYVYPDGKASDSFDLGVQFLSIQSAELISEASGTAGLLQICDYLFNPPQCTTHSYDAHLSWIFTPESGHDLAYGDQILTSTVTPYLFDITPESTFLLDGAGELIIKHSLLITYPETGITILEPSSFQISNVVLNIEGTVVPVPPALVLFLSGLIGLFGINNRLRERK